MATCRHVNGRFFPHRPHPILDQMLKVFAVAGFTSLVSMRLCDAMVPALANAFTVPTNEAATVISSFAITYGLMQLVYGPLGDRYGKARVITWVCALCTLAALAAALAPTLQTLAWARAAMGAGAAGIVPLALAWIGDTVPLAQRQVVIARYSAATISGIMIGVWFGGSLTEFAGWQAPFWVVGLMFMVVTLILWRKARGLTEAPAPRLPYWRQVRDLFASPWSKWIYGSVCLEGMLVFGSLAMLPTALYGLFNLPGSKSGGIVALFGVGGLVWSRVAGLILHRVKLSTIARASGCVLALAFGLLAWLPDWTWAIVACALVGFGFYPFHSTLLHNATQLSESRGLAVSMFGCMLFIGQSIGVGLAAFIFSRLEPAWFFGLAASALLLMSWVVALQLDKRSLHS